MNCTKKLDIRKIIARIDPPKKIVPSSVRPAAAASALARATPTVALEPKLVQKHY